MVNDIHVIYSYHATLTYLTPVLTFEYFTKTYVDEGPHTTAQLNLELNRWISKESSYTRRLATLRWRTSVLLLSWG